MPEVPPSRYQAGTHDFTLQAVMEMQKGVGELTAKTERLIADVKGQSDKVGELRDTLIWLKGAVAVIGLIGLVIAPLLTWFLDHNFPAPAPTISLSASAPAQQSVPGASVVGPQSTDTQPKWK